MIGAPAFLIVGSARSGTTLVQRLACELPGVVVPPETHFFDLFVPGLVARGLPPFDARRIEDEVREWCALPEVAGTDLDPKDVVHRLRGRCDAVHTMFCAVVAELTPDAQVAGEKTPNHLFWSAALQRVMPDLRVVALVRDPRAVVSSVLQTPWGRSMFSSRWGERSYVAVAERWLAEEELVRELAAQFPDRCLVLRYEDVVSDPEAVRRTLARFLGVAAAADRPPGTAPGTLAFPWETWKANVVGEISVDRTTSWRDELPARRRRVVTGLCATRMARWGYRVSASERFVGALARLSLGPLTRRRRRELRRGFRAHLRWIREVPL